jgi:tryptophan-rich sensory protein
VNKNMQNSYKWYSQLKKPKWAPPSWLFGPVWTVLYVLIFISFGKVFFMAIQKEIPVIIILPFVLNLFFNFIFTSIQFGLKNNLLAALDIILVWSTLIWTMFIIFPFAPWIAYIQIPYLLWVTFATILQFTVTYLNR